MITQVTVTSSGISGPARWGLLALVAGLVIAYPVLSIRLISNQRQALITSSLAAQTQAAHAVRNSIRAVGYRNTDIDAQLAEATELIHAGSRGSSLDIAIVANDGSLIAQSVDFPLTGTGDLATYKVLKSPDWLEFQFPEILASEISCGGELLLPSGARPGILIATDYSPAESWQVIVLSRIDGINAVLHDAKLYLLISFLSLALLLVVLILLFYLSLAAGLSSAINSAIALEEATVRFQESVGEFRRPLHNIQGLADMLEITEDPDERNGYLREIKGEVSSIIKGLETSDP